MGVVKAILVQCLCVLIFSSPAFSAPQVKWGENTPDYINIFLNLPQRGQQATESLVEFLDRNCSAAKYESTRQYFAKFPAAMQTSKQRACLFPPLWRDYLKVSDYLKKMVKNKVIISPVPLDEIAVRAVNWQLDPFSEDELANKNGSIESTAVRTMLHWLLARKALANLVDDVSAYMNTFAHPLSLRNNVVQIPLVKAYLSSPLRIHQIASYAVHMECEDAQTVCQLVRDQIQNWLIERREQKIKNLENVRAMLTFRKSTGPSEELTILRLLNNNDQQILQMTTDDILQIADFDIRPPVELLPTKVIQVQEYFVQSTLSPRSTLGSDLASAQVSVIKLNEVENAFAGVEKSPTLKTKLKHPQLGRIEQMIDKEIFEAYNAVEAFFYEREKDLITEKSQTSPEATTPATTEGGPAT